MKDDQDFVESLLRHDDDIAVRPEHEQRIREGLGALLGAAPPASPDAPNAPPAASPASDVARGALRHWIATGVIAAAAAGGGFAAGRASAPPPAVVEVPSTTVPAPSATIAPVPSPSSSVTPPSSAPAVASSVAPGAPPTAASPSDAFDREQSLLERARSALVHRDADAAQKALDEHARQFPRSRHAEERDYLHLQVLRERGDSDRLREAATTFLAKYPDSLLRARVEPLTR